MRNKIFILLFILFISLDLEASLNGYVKAGVQVRGQSISSSNSSDFQPFVDMYTTDDRSTGLVTRSRIRYSYTRENKDDFNEYTIDSLYFYADQYDYEKNKNWFLYIGDKTRVHSPVSVWNSKLRGVNAGVLLNSTKSLFDQTLLSGYIGFTKEKKKGFESSSMNTANQNGQFKQASYGGNLSVNFGKFNVDTLYNIYKDDQNSLKTNENYKTLPVKNDLFSTKAGYFASRNKIYAVYANSRYDSDLLNPTNKNLKGHAFYLESENHIEAHHLLARVSLVDERFFSLGSKDLVNDTLKFYAGDEWLMDLNTLSFSAAYKRNNTAFKPVQEILTDDELEFKAANVLNMQNELSLGGRLRYITAASKKEVNNSKNNWQLYEAGIDVTKMFLLDGYFKNLKTSLSTTYSKKADKSVVSGVKSGWQEYWTASLSGILDIVEWENSLTFLLYRINNQDGNNDNILSLSDRVGYLVMPD
ncbi:MAG: hypothetical protein PHF84_10150, partial [bacterium]|nr:hypothetical protein [bacterium]